MKLESTLLYYKCTNKKYTEVRALSFKPAQAKNIQKSNWTRGQGVLDTTPHDKEGFFQVDLNTSTLLEKFSQLDSFIKLCNSIYQILETLLIKTLSFLNLFSKKCL